MEALLKDGPLKGTTVEVEPAQGRPPATIDVPNGDEVVRYCLDEWVQEGPSADYTYLYPV